MASEVKRVALCGVILESNAFFPVAVEGDFRQELYIEGKELLAEARKPVSIVPREMASFVQTMDATGSWQSVPLLLTGCPPWDSIDSTFFQNCVSEFVDGLEDAGNLDGVYIGNYGAMVATDDSDPDGTLRAAVRRVVGIGTAVFATLVEATDSIIGY